MSHTNRCHYCGLWTNDVAGSPDNPWEGADVHGHCHDEAYYAAALARVRAMPELPPLGAEVRGRHMQRAVRRVGLERYLEVITGLART